jgi:hypothetical protein
MVRRPRDRDRKDAAALVAEAYALFLLGPMLLVVNESPRSESVILNRINWRCTSIAEAV